jgi:hypothetical protein
MAQATLSGPARLNLIKTQNGYKRPEQLGYGGQLNQRA